MKRTILSATVLAAGTGLLAAGCGSSAASATPKSGTETINGTLTGAAALASSPVFHLTFRGPVDTTATFPLGTAKKSQEHIFTTKAGSFVVAGSKGVNSQKLLSASSCRFEYGTTVTYTVSGAKSTGKFAGAKGSGKAVVHFEADLPKLKSGKCNESNSAQPAVSTAAGTFSGSGPLTLK